MATSNKKLGFQTIQSPLTGINTKDHSDNQQTATCAVMVTGAIIAAIQIAVSEVYSNSK